MNKQPSRTQILLEILAEMRRIQSDGGLRIDDGKMAWPDLLPIGDGRQLPSSELLSNSIEHYAASLLSNDANLRSNFSSNEITKLIRQSFGAELSVTDFDHDNAKIVTDLGDRVLKSFNAQCDERMRELNIVFGATFLTGPENYTTVVGPVSFEPRDAWLLRAEREGWLDHIDARRLRARWQGLRPKRRKRGWDHDLTMAEAIGNAPYVCSIKTLGLSSEMARIKALLVARLALTVVALTWSSPSVALDMMRLHPDGDGHLQKLVMFGASGMVGSSSAWVAIGRGQWVPQNFHTQWRESGWPQSFGEALTSYVDGRHPSQRPRSSNALFLALRWFYAGCRERDPLVAIVKFASALDALARGQKKRGIVALISARLGIHAAAPLMKGGSLTSAEIVGKIYDTVRSQMLHGTHQAFGEDFTELRATAEELSRRLLIEVAGWLVANPDSGDVGAWQR